jgi:hypothetical protein
VARKSNNGNGRNEKESSTEDTLSDVVHSARLGPAMRMWLVLQGRRLFSPLIMDAAQTARGAQPILHIKEGGRCVLLERGERG